MTPDVHALSGAYALDALTPDEAAEFEQHLASCEACRAEVASMREASGALADVVAEPAPEQLRASVLAGISAVRPLPPESADEPAKDELAQRRARRAPRWLAAAAAILAVLAAGATVRAVQLDRQLQSVVAAGDDVTRVLTAPDATTATARATTGGRAAVVSSAALGEAVLVTDGLPPAPAGSTYQVWYLNGSGAPTSAGFVPSGDRSAVVLRGDLATATGVGVTVEPAGGSTAPTTTPILAVQV
ncbi:MAG TPA: anti-sigma factor [Candidatus Nanopelagicales bacterium]|nr:anti-sigma factor [Candidatus Nanopelagicales bacterium]